VGSAPPVALFDFRLAPAVPTPLVGVGPPPDPETALSDDKAAGWPRRGGEVGRLDRERSFLRTEYGVPNEHDLVGVLYLRDRLDEALLQHPAAGPFVRSVDRWFRSFTVEDSGARIASIAGEDVAGRVGGGSGYPSTGRSRRIWRSTTVTALGRPD
jgi:hypothetical protein